MSKTLLILVLLLTTGGCLPCVAAEAKLVAIGAVLFDEPLTHLEMLELRVQRSPHLTLGALLVHARTERVLEDTQLRAHASFSANPGAWSIESRHLLSHGSQTDFRYRHRLRVIREGLAGMPGLSLRAYDEYFVDLNGRGSLRNMLTAGFGVTLGNKALAEIYHAWSDERYGSDARYWLLILSWRVSGP